MRILKIMTGLSLTLLLGFKGSELVHWKVADNYSVKWGKVTFGGLKTTILFDETHPERSKISATIDPNTVNTGNQEMTAHVKEALYTTKYRVISFESTAIKKTAESRYEVTGNFTLKGITREIKIPFSFDSKKNIMTRFPMVPMQTFYGTFIIIPKDYNITREGTPKEAVVELILPVTK